MTPFQRLKKVKFTLLAGENKNTKYKKNTFVHDLAWSSSTRSQEVRLVELMVHWNTSANIEAATSRKVEMCKELTTTIQGNDFKCLNIPLEIGTKVFINAKNKNILTQLCHSLRITKVSKVVKNCSKLAVLGSFSIWKASYSSGWNGGAVLKP